MIEHCDTLLTKGHAMSYDEMIRSMVTQAQARALRELRNTGILTRGANVGGDLYVTVRNSAGTRYGYITPDGEIVWPNY